CRRWRRLHFAEETPNDRFLDFLLEKHQVDLIVGHEEHPPRVQTARQPATQHQIVHLHTDNVLDADLRATEGCQRQILMMGSGDRGDRRNRGESLRGTSPPPSLSFLGAGGRSVGCAVTPRRRAKGPPGGNSGLFFSFYLTKCKIPC